MRWHARGETAFTAIGAWPLPSASRRWRAWVCSACLLWSHWFHPRLSARPCGPSRIVFSQPWLKAYKTAGCQCPLSAHSLSDWALQGFCADSGPSYVGGDSGHHWPVSIYNAARSRPWEKRWGLWCCRNDHGALTSHTCQTGKMISLSLAHHAPISQL